MQAGLMPTLAGFLIMMLIYPLGLVTHIVIREPGNSRLNNQTTEPNDYMGPDNPQDVPDGDGAQPGHAVFNDFDHVCFLSVLLQRGFRTGAARAWHAHAGTQGKPIIDSLTFGTFFSQAGTFRLCGLI